MLYAWTVSLVLVVSVWAEITGAAEMKVEITKHHPCAAHLGPQRTVLRFPSSKESAQQVTHIGDNCFVITGRGVRLARPGLLPSRHYQVLTDLFLAGSSELQACSNQDNLGCDGIGSCTYCDLCKLNERANKFGKQERSIFTLFKGNETVGCEKRVRPGRYNNLAVRFCLPTKEEMLSLLDADPERARTLWDTFARKTLDGSKQVVSMQVNVRLYNFPVNTYAMDPATRLQLTTGHRRGMISCHSIYFNIGNTEEETRRAV